MKREKIVGPLNCGTLSESHSQLVSKVQVEINMRASGPLSCVLHSLRRTHTHIECVIPDMFIQTKLDFRPKSPGALSLPGGSPPPPTPSIPGSLLVLLNPGEVSIFRD